MGASTSTATGLAPVTAAHGTIPPMIGAHGATPGAGLGAALSGVRGFLLDLDGVVILAGRPIDGAAEAIATLDRRGVPYRIVTNTSLLSRQELSGWGRRIGLDLPPERILSALSLSAAYTRRRHPARPLFVLASDDARTEFAGQHLLSDAEAGRPGATAAAVVIGDSPEAATYDNLNHAFRLVRGGAELIGMHRNPWWLTPDGPTLDSGAFVAGLEFATGQRATVIGKPSAAFFREAAAQLVAALPGASRRDLAMVGDDIFSDVLAAQRLGLRGIFVRSGKHGDAELVAAAARRRGGGAPTGVSASLAEVVAVFDRESD
jgi:HAD superfamily hydrolase (TIGR01458 family)